MTSSQQQSNVCVPLADGWHCIRNYTWQINCRNQSLAGHIVSDENVYQCSRQGTLCDPITGQCFMSGVYKLLYGGLAVLLFIVVMAFTVGLLAHRQHLWNKIESAEEYNELTNDETIETSSDESQTL
jgi:hypothetical protein